MMNGKGKISLKRLVSVLSIASFMLAAQGAVMTSFAAEEWELWPKGKNSGTPSAPQTGTPEATGAAKAGETAGKNTAGGVSAGTIGWAAAIGAGLIGVAIAIGSGGNGGTTSPPECQQ
jgi:hypothetical protein